MRYAVKFAYDGSLFHGSQRQGEEYSGSVEGSIVQALIDIGQYEKGGDWPVQLASRTDSGVSALGNVLALDSEMDPDVLLKALNSNLEGIWCWGSGNPRPTQNIRWASSRWYRYHLPPNTAGPWDIDALKEILSLFRGEHDFSFLSKREDDKNPVTLIERTDVLDLSGNGQLVAVDIIGSRFLWQQVRRMIGSALDVVDGKLDAESIKELLKGEDLSYQTRVMPPTGLILMDVHYKDIDFTASAKALETALERNSKAAWQASMRIILDSAMRSMFL